MDADKPVTRKELKDELDKLAATTSANLIELADRIKELEK
jgi:hypothetical protein